MLATRATANGQGSAVDRKREYQCDAEQVAAQGRSDELVAGDLGGDQPAVGAIQLIKGHDGRNQGAGGGVADHVGDTRHEHNDIQDAHRRPATGDQADQP